MSHPQHRDDDPPVHEFLRDPAAYPNPPTLVEVIETHISWIYLTDDHAYKLKKPVHFEFLDLSTPELRRQACWEELRLNRRLAEDVYLDVLPICGGAVGLQLGGSGTPVDWTVQMRRLPAHLALDAVLAREKPLNPSRTREIAAAIAKRLSQFYSRIPPEPVDPHHYRAAFLQRIEENDSTLLRLLPPELHAPLRRVTEAQLRVLALDFDHFDRRVESGRIVEGHGDLRPEHIYLEDPPRIIDCLEFSYELRQVDIADELAFLDMECQRIGAGELGRQLLSLYTESSGDAPPDIVLDFYRCYRACVRAKVAGLRGAQQGGFCGEASRLCRQYLNWADFYAERLGPPLLVVVGGTMGSGKSTVARELASTLGATIASTDQTRQALLGESEMPASYGAERYSPAAKQRVYDAVFRQARELLDQRRSVILDGTFIRRTFRDEVRRVAVQHRAVPRLVWCDCPPEIARERIAARPRARSSGSEARPELLDAQLAEAELPAGEERPIRVDTTQRRGSPPVDLLVELRAD